MTIKLDDLPYDILINILERLDYRDLISLSGVNKKFNEICDCNTLWRKKLLTNIYKWKLINSTTWPQEMFERMKREEDEYNVNGTIQNENEPIYYKKIYLTCSPDILTQKDILKQLRWFQQQGTTSSSCNENQSTLASLKSLSSIALDQMYNFVIQFDSENEETVHHPILPINKDPNRIPKVIMFGPGLETTTSCLVSNILWKSEFKTMGMIPGKGGYGSGIKLKLFNHMPFNLTTLYTNNFKERQQNVDHNLNSNLLLTINQNQLYELQPRVNTLISFCLSLFFFNLIFK
jgi:hypothetical protein